MSDATTVTPAENVDTFGPFDLDLLEETYGPIARREFERAEISYRYNLWQWAFEAVPAMDDRAFVRACSAAIYDSAQMMDHRGFEHLHFKARLAYAESNRRQRANHPDPACRATSLYQRGFDIAVRDAGHSHMAEDLVACTCATATDSPEKF